MAWTSFASASWTPASSSLSLSLEENIVESIQTQFRILVILPVHLEEEDLQRLVVIKALARC